MCLSQQQSPITNIEIIAAAAAAAVVGTNISVLFSILPLHFMIVQSHPPLFICIIKSTL